MTIKHATRYRNAQKARDTGQQIADQLHSGESSALQEAMLLIRRAGEALERAAKGEQHSQ